MRYVTSVEKIGYEKGLEKGREETAINLLNKGQSIEFISEITGFGPEKIRSLQKQIADNQASKSKK